MPDLDPTALQSTTDDPLDTPSLTTTAEPLQSLNPSNLTLSKPKDAVATNGAGANGSKTSGSKAEKEKAGGSASGGVTGQQRIDIEPIYAQLKREIGERWAEYKESIGLFVIGQLNQSELCLRIDHLITYSTETEHLHNCFIAALLANCHRDPPEAGVAPWVAASDKPASGLGGGATGKGGDKVEERLKREVKALPGRDRRRLKEIGEREPYDPNAGYPITQANDYRIARSIRLPDVVPTSAGGLNKTNLDLEIRKRYTHSSLSYETLEFPDSSSISHRLQSICYEEGLPSGAVDQCSEYVATATETYIKDVVANLLSLTRSNLLHGSGAARTKPPIGGGGEKASAVGGRAISLADMRFALEISGCNLGFMPDIVAEVRGGWSEGVLEGWDDYGMEMELEPTATLSSSSSLLTTSMNGYTVASTAELMPAKVNGVLTNGHVKGDVVFTNGKVLGEMEVDDDDDGDGVVATKMKEEEVELIKPRAKRKRDLLNGEMEYFRGVVEPAADGWAGSSTEDRDVLVGLLDECLSVG